MVAVDRLVPDVIFPQWRPLSPASSSTALVFTMRDPPLEPCSVDSVTCSGRAQRRPPLPPSTCRSATDRMQSGDLHPGAWPELGQPEWGTVSSHPPAPASLDHLPATWHPIPVPMVTSLSDGPPPPGNQSLPTFQRADLSNLLWKGRM